MKPPSLFRLLLGLLMLPAACSLQARQIIPTPQSYDAPTGQITTFDRYLHSGCHFAGAVDIESDLIVAGAPCWGWPPGEGTGSAEILRRTPEGELRLEATLTASDGEDGFQYDQHFGESVAINGNLIAAGAPGYDDPQAGDNTGAVYIFEYDGQSWVETGKLIANSPAPGAKIGRTLALDGDLLAASGAPEAGSVIIFQRQAIGWRQMAEVPVPASPDKEPTYALMDLYGDTLAISSISWQEPLDDADIPKIRSMGIVTLYERKGDAWKQAYQTAPQEASLFRMYNDSPFGLPVSLGGNGGKAKWLAVGKPGFGTSGRETGSVAIYERGRGGWAPQAELELAQGEAIQGALPFFGSDPGSTFFGAFVKLDGNRLGVVSTFANAAYIFETQGSGWDYHYRIIPVDESGGGDDFQRRTIALSGDSLLMGSPGEIMGGEVYLFNLPP
jgi:hypothetical protein